MYLRHRHGAHFIIKTEPANNVKTGKCHVKSLRRSGILNGPPARPRTWHLWAYNVIRALLREYTDTLIVYFTLQQLQRYRCLQCSRVAELHWALATERAALACATFYLWSINMSFNEGMPCASGRELHSIPYALAVISGHCCSLYNYCNM